MSDQSPVVATCAAVAASLLFLIPLAAGEIALTRAPDLEVAGVAAILYLGLLASGAAFALWNASLRYVSASSAGGYVNLVPVVGVGIALLAGHSLGPGQLVGGAIVAAGVWLSSRKTTSYARTPGRGRGGRAANSGTSGRSDNDSAEPFLPGAGERARRRITIWRRSTQSEGNQSLAGGTRGRIGDALRAERL